MYIYIYLLYMITNI